MKKTSLFVLVIIMMTVQTAYTFSPRRITGILENKYVNEASGVAVSAKNKDILWTFNDSNKDKEAKLYAFDTNGKDCGTYILKGIESRDWEDIAVGPGPEDGVQYLYIGEIGDNKARYDEKIIYRVKEPDIKHKKSAHHHIKDVDIIRFVYPDGAKDAETVMIDPLTKDIIIISKRETGVGAYILPYPQNTKEPMTAKKICTLKLGNEYEKSEFIVAGDISKDGSQILIKSYINVFRYKRDKGKTIGETLSSVPDTLYYDIEPQGEAIGWSVDGKGYYTISESGSIELKPRIYYYDLISQEKKKK